MYMIHSVFKLELCVLCSFPLLLNIMRRFMICIAYQMLVKEDEMAGACCVYGLEEKSLQSFERKCEGNCHAFSKGL